MKIKIVIANTLKPVDDVRAFEKIAQSIAKTNKYHVNIIGNTGKKETNPSDIEFNVHSLTWGSVFQRLLIRIKVLGLLFKINPTIVIVQTHELLLISLIHKLLKKSKIIYDVREDYKKNIQYLSPLPGIVRFPLSRFIRIKERLCAPFIDQFWLAEKCYTYEIGFPHNRSIVIENKALVLDKNRKPSKTFKCLFSGTISKYSEVLLAIETFKEISKNLPDSELTIIGQCHDLRLLKHLEEIEKSNKNVHLVASAYPVVHEEIIEQIFSSTLGLIPYQPNVVNQNKVPTKLYEYSHYGLPYLVQRETFWEQKGKELGGAISIDFHNPANASFLDNLESPEILFHPNYKESETWESQESLIHSSLNTLIP